MERFAESFAAVGFGPNLPGLLAYVQQFWEKGKKKKRTVIFCNPNIRKGKKGILFCEMLSWQKCVFL